ncbi:type VI secretion system baseplate subunit TssK [Comamonas sp. MYb21]|uniref:type VI secretion system baseplate subunit TssK n=1 Tax=Comamonas sp. MYb21 TaxID=1848648 RepID=UPI00309842CE
MFMRKVVWSEGMFLRPQHFQQQERYLEFFSHARSLAAEPYFWGFRELVLDVEALALGKLALLKAVGVFPDGTPFSFPGQDSMVEPLEIDKTCKDERIYLALPMRRPLATELSFADTGTLARYLAEDAELADSNEGAGEPALAQVAHMRARLIAESEMSDSWLRLGVVHVAERRNDGAVVLDERFIQPSIAYGQSRLLHAMVDDIAGLLQQRGEALAQRVLQPGRGGIAEVGDFMMLNIINRWQPKITHLRDHKILHPERVYGHLLELAGELSTFTRDDRRPMAYPVYDHDAPSPPFTTVVNDIRRSLSMVLEQNAIPIELHERQYGVRVGVIPDLGLVKQANFVLAVFAELPTDVVRTRFPTQVKIGPVEKIRDLVNLHLPGVRLHPMPIAPRELPYHANYNYFQLDTTNELWEQLERSGGVAMHVAGDFPGLRLEFWAIKP